MVAEEEDSVTIDTLSEGGEAILGVVDLGGTGGGSFGGSDFVITGNGAAFF